MYTGKATTDWSDPTFCASALDALTSKIVVLNRQGVVLAVNAAWVQFVDLNDLPFDEYGVGCNYLGFCDSRGTASGHAVAAGLRGLLAGNPGPFRHQYVIPPEMGALCLELSAVRAGDLNSPFLIIAHEDVSTHRQAERNLREATARLLHAEDDERRRIARELHDSTAQYLAGAKLMLLRLDERNSEGATPVRDEVASLLSSALDEIRSFAYLLHPPALEHLGLAAAIRQFASGFSRRADVAVTIEIADDFPRLSHSTEIALYRIVQEALANVHRHSGSQRAVVSMHLAGEMVLLSVRDFGAGLPPTRDNVPGVGLEGMRLRLEFLQGHLSLRNADPGLIVEAWTPFLADDREA
jgi:two-component system NarL family sensor kinase